MIITSDGITIDGELVSTDDLTAAKNVTGDIQAQLDDKVDHDTYTSGLATKADSSTVSSLSSTVDLKAPLESPSFTGNLTASGGISTLANASSMLGTTRLIDNQVFSLTTSAQSIYINGSNLIPTGTYILKIYLNGANWYSETRVGIMQWYGGTTNNGGATEIHLTGFGHAANAGTLYARVLRTYSNLNTHALQIWASVNSSPNITIDVKRIM